jgi:hypothetical protein
MKAYFRIPYRKGRPANVVGAHARMEYGDRILLGDIRAIEYQEGPPSGYFLTVHHFNGEPWPIKPNAGAVFVLDRTWKDGAA